MLSNQVTTRGKSCQSAMARSFMRTTAGITDAQKRAFHAAFEQRHPEAHEGFLAYLGLEPPAIAPIRAEARRG